MAVKPWIGAIVPPSSPPPIVKSEPDINYALEYCYGYRTYDCRNNLFFSSNGKVIYNAATLGIIHDAEKNTQAFFGGGMQSKAIKKNMN